MKKILIISFLATCFLIVSGFVFYNFNTSKKHTKLLEISSINTTYSLRSLISPLTASVMSVSESGGTVL